jgi:coenzyme F420-reducing hydrogenase delta subunit
MLAQLGVEEERVRLEWVSASEGDRFASIVDDMTKQLRKLGPFSLNNGGEGDRLASIADEMTEQMEELGSSKHDDGGKDG